MAFMVLVACSVATAQFYDPNDANNQANASIIADLPVAPVTVNVTIGENASVLSPSQSQDPNQAQSQTQTSTNTNNNSLSNVNTNVAISTFSSANVNTITNANTFNPVIVVNNSNG